MNPKTLPTSKRGCLAAIVCGFLILCSVSLVGRVCFMIIRSRDWQPEQAEVVAAIIDGNWEDRWSQGDSHPTSWLVSSESAALLKQVKTCQWISEDSVDLIDLAAREGRNWIYIGKVQIVQISAFELSVHLGTWPRQVTGKERVVFLSGGSSIFKIRPKIMWLLFGKGSKYEILYSGEIIS